METQLRRAPTHRASVATGNRANADRSRSGEPFGHAHRCGPYGPQHRPAGGLTSIELLVASSILSLLLAWSIPAYRNAQIAGHAAAERTALTEALMMAMEQSMVSDNHVVACASRDGAGCDGSMDWSWGWIVFADTNGNREHDPGEALLRVHPRLPADVRLRTSKGRTRIVFQPHGGVNAGSNATFTFCDAEGKPLDRTLILANSGNMRSAQTGPAQALACLAAD